MTAPIQSFYNFSGDTYCEPCVWKASREAKEQGKPGTYTPLYDHSICARCGADNGETEFPMFGNLPLCPTCSPQITNWPYPQWLKISLASLLVLLVVALVYGRRYFRAGFNMYAAERLVEQQRYAEVIERLHYTLQVAPESDKAVMLMVKAGVLGVDLDSADKAIEGHNKGYFENTDSDEFREMDALWKRAMEAMDKYDKADKLGKQPGHDDEVAKLMREAANLYPEAKGLASAADAAEEGAAFERKDYNQFLAISQKFWQQQPSSDTAAGVASALACEYVVTGDKSYKQKAEEMLAKSQEMAQSDQDAQKRLPEYYERIRYRLDKKEIIDKPEYDRRFRSVKAQQQ